MSALGQALLNDLALRKCWCYTCDFNGVTKTPLLGGMRTRMNLCPDCGNKRCPRALYHESACMHSTAAPDEP